MSTQHTFRPVTEQLSILTKGAAEVIPRGELRVKLEPSRATGTPLRVKLGVDPTAPDLHLGHTVVLRKLKHFQDQGHTAIFLIGDFTALVGDPTGQSETRPALSPEQVKANAETYLAQVYKILDRERTEVRYNSEWLGKLTAYEIVKLQGHYRLARMLEHEDFRSRLANNQPLSVHELLYPLLQAYDSVILKADVELGATEQKFNLLVGRDIQQEYGQPSQVVMTMPILVGLDGVRKMSKSLGNYVGVNEPSSQMFGKLMSISDELMWSYYELLTDFAEPVIVRLKEEVRAGVLHPMETKMQLAHNIIAGFHGEEAAQKATDEFQRVFRDRSAPEVMSIVNLRVGQVKRISQILLEKGAVSTLSEAGRMMSQGGVELDGQRITYERAVLNTSTAGEQILRAGKKTFLRVVIE